jgi:hypothetical protein
MMNVNLTVLHSILLQSAKLGSIPKPDACKIVHGRIK